MRNDESGVLPPTYVSTTYWPFEAADQIATMRQAITLIKASSHIAPDFAHLQALDAWLLWATAAKACGSQLTGDCVISHAGGQKGWTGGGIIAPVNTRVGPGVLSDCFVLLKATPTGFVLAPEIMAESWLSRGYRGGLTGKDCRAGNSQPVAYT